MFRKPRRPEAMRHLRTYPSSPRGFDPHAASQEELLRYGFPQRPDPEEHPELARLWNRVLARPIRFVEAELAIDPVMSARDPLIQASDEFGATGWAGVVKMLAHKAGSDFTQPAAMVFAQFELPDVQRKTPNDETIAVAFWVGLDGFSALPHPADTQVLQAGVVAQVSVSGWWWWKHTKVEWWAWTEWLSALHAGEDANEAVKVKNFPVAPGDTIFVVVCAPEPDFGYVSMLNISQGIGASVGINALSGIVAHGLSAEWIVELPPQSPHMPYFSPVTFTDCTGGSLQHGIFNLTDGLPVDISVPAPGSFYGQKITTSTIAPGDPPPPTVAVVEELKLDWP
jgi:Peptidase A4 family